MFVQRELRADPRRPVLTVGLLNNMPRSAFRSTEAQFGRVLRHASDCLGPKLRVHLRCFTARPASGSHYDNLDALWRSRLDGLIVTGAQPQALSMTEEPLFPLVQQLADWAASNTVSTIWSCLAAHAVVQMDGVTRRRLPKKLSGLFVCQHVAPMPDEQSGWLVPHSRHNDLDGAELEEAGYTILTRGPGAHSDTDGVNSFEKIVGLSRFLMLQGHPEYEADTLLREYRRDVRLYLAGSTPSLPEPPTGYFDDVAMRELAELQAQWSSPPQPGALALLDPMMRAPEPRWHSDAVQQFSRWLMQIAASSHGAAMTGLQLTAQ